MNDRHSSLDRAVAAGPARKQLVHALRKFRREWQRTAGTADLVQLRVPVGLVIDDVAGCLGLSPQERHSVLGRELQSAVSTFLQDTVRTV